MNSRDLPIKLVLIVEDEPSIQVLLENMVREQGLEPKCAPSGIDAITLIPALKPDIILLDLMLPGMSGMQILDMLRTGEFSKIPVIVLSGVSYQLAAKEKMANYPNLIAVLSKPIVFTQFSEAIAQALKRLR